MWEFHRLPDNTGLDGLVSAEFTGIKIPEAMQTLPKLRLHLTMETAGEGLGEMLLRETFPSGTSSQIFIWNGMLDPAGRHVSVQSMLSPGATEITIIMRKPKRYMQLAVRGIKLCLFEGSTSASKK